MASTNRSSNINLYSVEDKLDGDYKFEIENTQSDVKFEAGASQDAKFKFSSYQFHKGASYFDLDVRFSGLENDTTGADNAAAIVVLQAADATEAVARQAADTSNSNATQAEVNARVLAVAVVQGALDAQEAKQETEKDASNAAVAAEEAARITAVAAEAATARAAEVALGVRIDNVLSNTDPANLDSLSELLAAYSAADSSLGNLIAAAVVRIETLEAQILELTQNA